MVPFMMGGVEALALIIVTSVGRKGVVKVASSYGTAIGVVVHFATRVEAWRSTHGRAEL